MSYTVNYTEDLGGEEIRYVLEVEADVHPGCRASWHSPGEPTFVEDVRVVGVVEAYFFHHKSKLGVPMDFDALDKIATEFELRLLTAKVCDDSGVHKQLITEWEREEEFRAEAAECRRGRWI